MFLKESKKPIQFKLNYFMLIEECGAIQKSFVDVKSSLLWTAGNGFLLDRTIQIN